MRGGMRARQCIKLTDEAGTPPPSGAPPPGSFQGSPHGSGAPKVPPPDSYLPPPAGPPPTMPPASAAPPMYPPPSAVPPGYPAMPPGNFACYCCLSLQLFSFVSRFPPFLLLLLLSWVFLPTSFAFLFLPAISYHHFHPLPFPHRCSRWVSSPLPIATSSFLPSTIFRASSSLPLSSLLSLFLFHLHLTVLKGSYVPGPYSGTGGGGGYSYSITYAGKGKKFKKMKAFPHVAACELPFLFLLLILYNPRRCFGLGCVCVCARVC